MKSPERVFQELLEDSITFNLGFRIADQYPRATFQEIMRVFRDQDHGWHSVARRSGHFYAMPETTLEDIVDSHKRFVEAMQLQGKSPETTVVVLKKVFEPIFAARFEDHREIMSFLYRLTQDAEMLDRLIRA